MTLLRLVLAVWALVLAAGHVSAHEIRPVSMEVREVAQDRYAVRWKVPAVEGRILAIRPSFDAKCTGWRNILPRPEGDSAVARFQVLCPGGIAGTRIGLDNLSRTMIDGVVTVELLSGQTSVTRVRPTAPSMVVPASTSALDVFRDYVVVGVEHIWFGPDHLLFVLALLLLVDGWRRLVVTATAFTLAHSLTLSLAALGVLRIPVPPIEALIALSILYMAVELVRKSRGEERSQVSPWLLAFTFGLLHGLGFASALAEVGLPNHQIPAALLAFNVGVEIGQIAFIVVVLALREALRRISAAAERAAYWCAAYGIGGMASFWVIDRVAGF